MDYFTKHIVFQFGIEWASKEKRKENEKKMYVY